VIICIPSATPSPSIPSIPSPTMTAAASSPIPLLTNPPTEVLIPIGDLHLSSPFDSNPQKSHHRTAEIGISIHPDYQNRGYGSEAIQWCLEWAFQRANLHRVEIGAFEWNTGAVRCYERVCIHFVYAWEVVRGDGGGGGRLK
jgi:hypothetical protein